MARRTGWEAIELRREDLEQAAAVEGSMERALDVLRSGEVPVAYHFQRSGADARSLGDLEPGEIVYVQYSDVPARVEPGKFLDRLPPGRGVVPFAGLFAALADRGYTGY